MTEAISTAGAGARPVWLARAGKHGEDEAAALEEGRAIIGFHHVPDLTGQEADQIATTLRATYPDANEKRLRNFLSQLDMFVNRISEGDLIVLPLKTASGRIAIGECTGPYEYRQIAGSHRHTRPVRWVRTDVPRPDIGQDLLYSLGAFLTVCRVTRNEAERRLQAVAAGRMDPGPARATQGPSAAAPTPVPEDTTDSGAPLDLAELAHEQILSEIRSRFAGHGLARLVASILEADGHTTRTSPPGADGGVDILAGRGALGFDGPRLCVQVKSGEKAEDVTALRALQGTMQTFGADQGLLVALGGFTRATTNEARQSFFTVRLWDASDLVDALYQSYDRLPEEVRAELPLKRIWALVMEE